MFLKRPKLAIVVILAIVAMTVTGCGATDQVELEEPKDVIETDVVVIGSGAAGLAAALEARDQGVEVILLEKMNFTGGTTRYAAGGLCAAGVDIQLEHGITEDSPEVHFEDMMRIGKNRNNPELVKVLTNNAKDAVDWVRTKGIKLEDEVVSYSTTYPRIYWPEGGGAGLVSGLTQAAEEAGIEIKLNTRATKLLQEEDKVVGVVAENDGEEITYKASRGVVLATGGFAWNQDLIKEFIPELEGIRTNNPEDVSTGDGITMAQELGAKLVDMELGRFVPLGVRLGKSAWTSAPKELLDAGGLLVNKEGKEFLTEAEQGRDLAAKILAQTEHTAYLILDQETVDTVGKEALQEIQDGGALYKGDVEKIAQELNLDIEGLEQTIGEREDTLYAIIIEPYIHSTTGGVAINTSAQVLRDDGKVIPGLYAAGEVTGGIQGADQKNALIDCLVFGRIAGGNVAK